MCRVDVSGTCLQQGHRLLSYSFICFIFAPMPQNPVQCFANHNWKACDYEDRQVRKGSKFICGNTVQATRSLSQRYWRRVFLPIHCLMWKAILSCNLTPPISIDHPSWKNLAFGMKDECSCAVSNLCCAILSTMIFSCVSLGSRWTGVYLSQCS